MEQHLIKVFGERNTGTRAILRMLASVPNIRRRLAPKSRAIGDGAVIAAIEANLVGAWRRHYLHTLKDEASLLEGVNDPWKHALPELTPAMIIAEVKTIFMIRNPYSWFLALARRPYHMKGPIAHSLLEFAERPWMTERRENLSTILRAPSELWNRKVAAYQTYQGDAQKAGLLCEFIVFEDFVNDSHASLTHVLEKFDIPSDGVVALPQNTKRERMPPKELAQYYGQEKWKTYLTRGLVQTLNAQFDWDLASTFGYQKLDPFDFPETHSAAVLAQIKENMTGIRAALDRKAGAASAA